MKDRMRLLRRLDDLIGALRDRGLTASEAQELRSLLDLIPSGYRRLSEHMFLASALPEEVLAYRRSRENAVHTRKRADRVRRWTIVGVCICAASWAIVLALRHHDKVPRSEMPGAAPAERMDYGVAVLTQSVGAKWNAGGGIPKSGQALPPGRVQLLEGIARLEFYSGATVILDGATDLRLVSVSEVLLYRGKLRAMVPYHARGFTVQSPQVRLVDRGTEFGIIAEREMGTQVHVFNGKVELYDSNADPVAAEPLDILAGDAVRVDPHRIRSNMGAFPEQFTSVQELDRNIATKRKERFRHWRDLSRDLQTDPRVAAYYDFERDQRDDRVLRCSARHVNESMQGSIVGCSWSMGRWPGKAALEFKRPSDRVRIMIPGEYASMTIAAWVRIDGFDNTYNSLLLSDGWFRAGALHWQITNLGINELAVWPFNPPAGFIPNYKDIQKPHFFDPNYDTREPLTVYDLGRWVHLAVVYDGAQRFVTHLVDGIEVSREPLRADARIAIGSAQIGNWDPLNAMTSKPIRNFNGRIDELVVYSVALSEVELRNLSEVGKP